MVAIGRIVQLIKTSLRKSKVQSEAAKQRTDNTMVKKEKDKRENNDP